MKPLFTFAEVCSVYRYSKERYGEPDVGKWSIHISSSPHTGVPCFHAFISTLLRIHTDLAPPAIQNMC